MENWRKALKIFLEDWPYTSELAGVMVCGSYITGNPSERSDIDVHMVLKDGEDWRERGNRLVEGYLIEYFCNPPAQIRKYFEGDHEERSTHAAVQFATGEILFDHEGTIGVLKKEALQWLQRPFEQTGETGVEFIKYAIWDSADNLLDLYEKGGSDLRFVYFNSLKELFNQYCQFLAVEQIPFYQIGAYLSDETYLKKYLKDPFPDKDFSSLFLKSLSAGTEEEMVSYFEKLSSYVLVKMGGFTIDGWKLKSPIEK
ncbi:nucleotidyltransferase domain-containing protein [Bacillus salacetis]|uniref:nucleotidyltransferase domain-containing protein n=1 Tax=Bacillus salacetis TaxID=2315464 RepID=UPI003BA2E701